MCISTTLFLTIFSMHAGTFQYSTTFCNFSSMTIIIYYILRTFAVWTPGLHVQMYVCNIFEDAWRNGEISLYLFCLLYRFVDTAETF